MTDYYPPKNIVDLFDTEELALNRGRAAFLDWCKALNTQVGDRILVPEVSGSVWYEQGERTQ